jgi:hypothetical protein
MEESKKIYAAMAAIQRDLDAIAKNSRNTQQGFHFRGIDAVYNEMHEHFAKHGVFCLPEVIEERSEERQTQKGGTLIYRILKIRYTFMADDGSWVSCVVIGEGMDSGDKASNKAMSIAHKYALFQIFTIPTEDMIDPDAESHNVAPAPPQQRVVQPQALPPPITTPNGKPGIKIVEKHSKMLCGSPESWAEYQKWFAVYHNGISYETMRDDAKNYNMLIKAVCYFLVDVEGRDKKEVEEAAAKLAGELRK